MATARADVPRLDEAQAVAAAEAALGRLVPDLVLTDRQGRAVSLSRYRGKPLLVSFVYTGCFQVCPTQTRALADALDGLDRAFGPSQYNVATIGFNHPFDSPAAMRAFAAQHGLSRPNWEFFSPDGAQAATLTRAFGFSYVATPAGFDHVLGVTIVDAQGRIHRQVYGDRLRADQLGEPLRTLLRDAPAQALSVEGLVERVRILCTVYDPETGKYRYDLKLILELIGGAVFFSGVALYLLLEWLSQRKLRRREQCASASSPVARGC
ncbi:MAG TPA: SCO family protein [Burkholderiaceae bacterium]|nr:SCO family protein [Burkholderiaceae bacterium]